MKKIILLTILLSAISCKVCYETKNSFNNSLKHTELTPVTINELKEKVTTTQADYTIMVIYDICNSTSSYINDVVIPYYNQQTDKEKINLIFVQKDRRARKVPSSEVYTVQEAKDFLLLFQIVWAELIVPMALVLANPDFSFVSGIVAALEEAIERDVWLF